MSPAGLPRAGLAVLEGEPTRERKIIEKANDKRDGRFFFLALRVSGGGSPCCSPNVTSQKRHIDNQSALDLGSANSCIYVLQSLDEFESD